MAQRFPSLAMCIVLAGSMPIAAGCIQRKTDEAYYVVIEVRSKTGETIKCWAVESVLRSVAGWPDMGRPAEESESLLAVFYQDPSHNVYEVPPITDEGIILVPPLAYGKVSSENCRIYAVGYEIGRAVASFQDEPAQPGKDGKAIRRKVHFSYLLTPWTNVWSESAGRLLATLRDKKNFEQYEALRGTPKGTGVPELYRYYIERFEAIRRDNLGMPIDPSVFSTVDWLRRTSSGKNP